MKKNINYYNSLLRSYNKYRRKLANLRRANRNERRQHILRKHIEKLFEKLTYLKASIKLATATAGVTLGLLAFAPQNASAQIAFFPQQVNPLSLVDIGYSSTPTFADMDNDGDLDILSGEDNGDFYYFENIGTASAPAFAAPITNPFGLTDIGNNSSPTLVDMDNDGDLDLISGERDGDFYYFENTGSASAPAFAAPIANPFGLTEVGYNSTPTLVDMDNDGDLDLLSGDYYGDFYYFENTGSVSAPAFAAPITNAFGLTGLGYYSTPAFADTDNDGDFDLLSGDRYGNFYYFENTGTASAPVFAAPITNPFELTNSGYNSTPAFADIDNDGDLDLLSGNSYGEFFYAENLGVISSLTFLAPVSNPFGLANTGGKDSFLTYADMDNDGDLDLISGSEYGDFYFFKNIGSASAPVFDAPITNAYGLTNIGKNSFPTLVDIDNDGDFDILSGEYYGDFYYFENTGDAANPAFAAPVTNYFGLTNMGYGSAPAFADMDNDGDLDLLSGDWYGDFYYFENTGSASAPAFDAPITNAFGLSGIGYYSAPTFADIDNDGDLDILSGDGNYYGDFYYFENTGTASAPAYAAPTTNPFRLTNIGYGSYPTFVDMDNDGDLDILSGDRYGELYYFENVGVVPSLTFDDPRTAPFGLSDIGSYSSPTFADMDNDGDLDLLSGERNGDFYYFENTGTASNFAFATATTNPFGLSDIGFYSSPTFVDIDNDGDFDVLSGDLYGDFYYFENTGSASAPAFATPIINHFGLSNIGSYSYSSPTFADMDGDGDLDMLSGNSYGEFVYFENTGSASAPAFAAPTTNDFGLIDIGGKSSPRLVDVDNDGDFDLLSGERDGGFVYFENIGTALLANFAAPTTNPFRLTDVGDRSTPTLMDINNDGNLDLLSGEEDGDFYLFLGCAVTTSTISPTAACSYTSPSGQIHTTSGVFIDIIPNATGCDSIITINLTIESIADQTVSSTAPFVCNSGTTTIDLGSSQNGVNYYLRNNDNDTIVDGPIMGDGSSITFNTDTISSPTTFNVFGEGSAPSTGLEFDGNNDYVDAGTGINLANSSFSIEFWAKKSVLSSGSDDHIIGLGDNTTTNNALHIGFRGGNQFTFAFFGNDMDAPSNLADTDWHHWAVTFDAVTKGRMIFRDGVAVMGGVSSSNFLGTGNLKIGKAYTSVPFDNNHFAGSVDEVRIWNSTRTQSEIQENMNTCLTGTEANLLAYYKFEDGTGSTTLTDATVNANHGALQNMDENTAWGIGSTVCSTCNIEMTQTITINVEQPTAATISPTACNSYLSPSGNYTWTTSATYLDTIPNVAGCDSVITVNLTINTVDVTVDNSLMPILSANQAGATYRWLDCDNGNAPISGETNQTFTATVNGNYAVEVTFNGCTEVSACEAVTGVGINEATNNVVSIHPNPTNGMVNINFGSNNSVVDYAISSIEGRIIETGKTSSNNITVDLSNESKGVYFIKINTETTSTVYKLIKQ